MFRLFNSVNPLCLCVCIYTNKYYYYYNTVEEFLSEVNLKSGLVRAGGRGGPLDQDR